MPVPFRRTSRFLWNPGPVSPRIAGLSSTLLAFETADGLSLPGLLYEPPRRSREAALLLHGNGDASVFYSTARTNAFGEQLRREKIALFAFNNRGAHLIKSFTKRTRTRKRSILQGMTYERIRDCVHDIDGAIAALRSRGYRRFHLIGHSTGANKICVYNARRPRNPVARYVLLSPGDDVGIYHQTLGAKRFERALERSREAVRAGRADAIAPPSFSPFPISWGSLFDTINPDGDYNVFPFLEELRGLDLSSRPRFRHFRKVRKPTLALAGREDELYFGEVDRCMEMLEERAAVPRTFRTRILPDANHGFRGREQEAGRIIAQFLSS